MSLGYSQKELSGLSGIDQASICRLEAGRDSLISTYERLAAAMEGRLSVTVRFSRPWPEVVEARDAAREAQSREYADERRRRRREKLRTASPPSRPDGTG